MATNEKCGTALVTLSVLIVAALLVWAAWGGARTANRDLSVAPRIDLPSVPVPNLPEGPRAPDAPIPRPR